jgi:hypothetical protein
MGMRGQALTEAQDAHSMGAALLLEFDDRFRKRTVPQHVLKGDRCSACAHLDLSAKGLLEAAKNANSLAAAERDSLMSLWHKSEDLKKQVLKSMNATWRTPKTILKHVAKRVGAVGSYEDDYTMAYWMERLLDSMPEDTESTYRRRKYVYRKLTTMVREEKAQREAERKAAQLAAEARRARAEKLQFARNVINLLTGAVFSELGVEVSLDFKHYYWGRAHSERETQAELESLRRAEAHLRATAPEGVDLSEIQTIPGGADDAVE